MAAPLLAMLSVNELERIVMLLFMQSIAPPFICEIDPRLEKIESIIVTLLSFVTYSACLQSVTKI